MKRFFFAGFLYIAVQGCAQNTSQPTVSTSRHVGGACEGCEAIHETSIPFAKLGWTDTLPDFNEPGPKLVVSGTVYQQDGKTPAPDVVLYVYHTNQEGIYPKRGDERGWSSRHGYIRGWVKTNGQGQYRFYTLKPAVYPSRTDPAHIHITVKEPDKNEYWIDDFQFDDDPLLTADKRSRQQNRGGNGIVKLQSQDGMLTATRAIVLGKNVPDYPTALSRN